MYLYLGILLIGLFTGATGAYKIQAWRFDAARAEAMEQQRETEKMRRQSANTASAGLEVAREKIRTEFKTITERVNVEVEKPIYRNVCLASDGLQQLADAARATGYTSEPASPMPAASAPK